MDKIRDPIKVAALSLGINSTVLLNRLESMIIQIDQMSNDQNEDGPKTRIISFREIVLSPTLTVCTNEENKSRSFEERAKMVSSLMYLAIPELWQHDKKMASEINNWNYGPPTWRQIKQMDLWKLIKIKKIRITDGTNRTNSFHRLYTLIKGLFHMDLNANDTFKKITWQWLAEKAEYEIIMVIPV